MQLHLKKKLGVFCAIAAMALGSTAAAAPIQNPDGSAPLVHWAILEAKEGQMDAMLALGAKGVAPYAAKEPGTYALYGGVDKAQPHLLRLLEIYRDEAAYQAHRASAGFQKYLTDRADILVSLKIMEADPFVLETKTSGVGSVVRMARLEIDPQNLAAYKAALREEIVKSVAAEPGVLALLATTEKENPHIFHLLEIYQDDAAYAAHIKSPHFQTYNRQTQSMVLAKTLIETLPATIRLTGKPFAAHS